MPKPRPAARTVEPRVWALLGTAAATGLTVAMAAPAPQAVASGLAPAAQNIVVAGEVGESGEGAVATEEAEVAFLTRLGFFEATHHIVAGLYASGHADLAREHLELSHHASYVDIEGDLATFHAEGFEPLALAFAAAVTGKADKSEVAAKAQAVLEAIGRVHETATLSPRDEMKALSLIAATAAEDFDAGVADGRVEVGQEYRDSWGFLTAANAEAARLAAARDAATAKAGATAQQVLTEALTQFPALVSETAGTETDLIHSAAAWIDFAVLRMK